MTAENLSVHILTIARLRRYIFYIITEMSYEGISDLGHIPAAT